MDEEQLQKEEKQETSWRQFLATVKEEVTWLLQTVGILTISLAVGRLIQKLTGSGTIDPNVFRSGEWQSEVDRRLQERERHTRKNGRDDEEDDL